MKADFSVRTLQESSAKVNSLIGRVHRSHLIGLTDPAAKPRVRWRRVRRKSAGAYRQVAREHPRYERAKLEIGPPEIIRTVARMYRVEEAEVLSRESRKRK
jgi:hypothetical protein